MDRSTELELIDELLALQKEGDLYLAETATHNPYEHYASEAHFAEEQKKIFRKTPNLAAHISDLANPGDFLRKDIAGIPVLLTHDRNGDIKAFVNACRHRGTRLVDDTSGCKHKFTCPYHAWTYSSSGDLIAAPHFEKGFPGQEKQNLGLRTLQCDVRFGFVWVTPEPAEDFDFDAFFSAIAPDLEALEIDSLAVAIDHEEVRAANWKILVEGGIEAYHFKVAHKNTIGPYFEDNLSSFRMLDPHMRSILPRATMAGLSAESRETWRIRDHANVLYSLFPNATLLVQQDHIVCIIADAQGAGKTAMRLMTLAPKERLEEKEHWKINHKITTVTLDEDFTIGESIQSTLASGPGQEMLFGRFEGALHQFNEVVSTYLR